MPAARPHFACLLLAGALTSSGAAAPPSVSQVLALHGHPETRACSIESSQGLGRLLTIEGNWRLGSDAPVDFLAAFHDGLSDDLRDSPAEAYILFSQGIVQQRLRRFDDSIAALERANAILGAAGTDPYGIRPYILVPLVHHAADVGNEEAADRYLAALAPIIGNVDSHSGDYLPLVKKAPVYPIRAMERGITGYVLLEFTVDGKGRVVNPAIVEESPPGAGFGPAALEAAAVFRYIPKVVDGRFVSVDGVRNLITFELQ